ncbi:MAG: amino acid adenylation domain-containing protein [Oleiphilaceae bacterium]|nr:amino acid adenylation domain-containing protein [Oleiphilaceae bacterium]
MAKETAARVYKEFACQELAFEAVLYRHGYRYAEAYQKSALPVTTSPALNEGAYLITGGLGGLGLALADYLAGFKGVKLGLVTHRDFPAENEWPEHSNRNTRIGRRVQRLQQLKQRAASVKVLHGDVTDSASLTSALEEARASLGEIKGIFHTAGVIDDQLISLKNYEQAKRVLAPKVEGARNLLAACAKDNPDFVVLYSSVSALTGMSGQFDYAAANAYLDALVYQARRQGINATSINWSAWRQVGMAAELAAGERTMGAGPAAFAAYTEGNQYRLYVDAQVWWVDEHRTKTGLALVPGTGFVDAAYAAGSAMLADLLTEGTAIRLENLFFSTPMMVHDSEQKVMSVQLTEVSPRRYRLLIASARSHEDADMENWLAEHVEGELIVVSDAAPEACDVQTIQSRCKYDEIIRRGSAEHAHMDFGPRWACVETVALGESEALVHLKLPNDYAADLDTSTLHPAMLDMATGAGHILVSDYDSERDFFVPLSYGRVTVFAPFQSEFYAHVRWLKDDGNASHFDVLMCAPDGQPLVSVESFIVKRMAASALDEIDTAISAELDVDLAMAISPEEGEEVIKRVLAYRQCPQLIVSPLDFDGILEQLRAPQQSGGALSEAVERPTLDSDFAAPETPFQKKMAEMWAAALGIDQIGIDDNFFELGGHSLLLTQLATKAKKSFGVDLPLSKLFDSPTIREWAVFAGDVDIVEVDTKDRAASSGVQTAYEIEPFERASSEFSYPLSATQAALWFVHEIAEENPAYNIPVAVRFKGDFDISSAQHAFKWLIARHEILRTTYDDTHGDIVQCIKAHSDEALQELKTEVGALDALLAELARKPFNLRSGSPLVGYVIKVTDADHVLFFNFHHIAIDHLSLLQLMREFEIAYNAYASNSQPELSPQRLQYADYIHWFNAQITEEQIAQKLEVWKQRLAGFSGVLDLPLDRPRPPVPTGNGEQFLFDFSDELSRKAIDFCSSRSVSLFNALLANFCVLLGRYSNQDDIIIGTPFANRSNQEELDDVVGCFINVLPLATNLADSQSFNALIDSIKQVMFEAYDNQEVPLNRIVDGVNPVRDPGYNPLFQVGFIFQEPPAAIKLNGLDSDVIPVHSGGAMYDIHLWIWQEGKSLSGLIWYNTDIFDAASMHALKERFAVLLDHLIDAADEDFREQSLLTESDRQLYDQLNSTNQVMPAAATIHGQISAVAAQRADAVAVIGQDGQLSYRELDARSDMMAHFLAAKGVGSGNSVGISMSRGCDMLVAILGTLKVGATYIPMDPDYPSERLAYMADLAGIELILCTDSVRSGIDYFDKELISVDSQWQEIAAGPAAQLPQVSPDTIAYIIFTSGSTGLPKGVQVQHRTVVNLLESMRIRPGYTAEDRLLAVTTLSFDMSVVELYLPLFSGGSVVVASEDEVKDGSALIDLISRHEVNVMQATPSTWRSMMTAGWQGGLSKTMCGGEPYPADLASFMSRTCGEVWNLYGPTETTVYSLGRVVSTERPNMIGTPVANTQCFIVNDKNVPQPVGVMGELIIGGDGVTQGYLKRPELTEQVFVRCDNLGPGVFYRTGDAARLTATGEIEYIQRLDNQVKVRGYRIELGEIESVLLKHDAVDNCTALVKQYSDMDKRIVVYVQYSKEQPAPEASEVKDYLRAYLPEYMVPQIVVEMEQLPLTPNGKIDRKALPEPEAGVSTSGEYIAPESELEQHIADLWQEVLGAEQISVCDNFFELGGHSLILIQIVSRLRERYPNSLALSSLISAPSIREWAVLLQQDLGVEERQSAPVKPITKIQRDALRDERGQNLVYSLSPTQSALWFIYEMAGDTPAYNIPVAQRYRGPLDVERLRQAYAALVQKYEILRTTYGHIDGEMVQYVHTPGKVDFSVVDVSEEQLAEQVQQAAEQPFDLRKGSPIVARVFRVSDEDHVVLVTVHHIAADHSSLLVFMREIGENYQRLGRGELPDTDADVIQYIDYVNWLGHEAATSDFDQKIKVWEERLANFSGVLNLPLDKPRPSMPSGRGKQVQFDFDAQVSRKVKQFSAANSVSLYLTLLSGFCVLLNRYCAQDDIIVGTPFANRLGHPDLDKVMGCFINTLPLAIDLGDCDSFDSVVKAVEQVMFEAYDHQDVPLNKIVDAVKPARDLSYNPLFQVGFVFQEPPAEIPIEDLDTVLLPVHSGGAMYDIHLWIWEKDGVLSGVMQYNTDVFEESTIERMHEQLALVMDRMITQSDAAFREQSLLTDKESALYRSLNATEKALPDCLTVHGLVAAQAQKVPENVAVVGPENAEQLTFAELQQRSDQLASYLIDRGVKPGDRVGISIHRGTDMMVGLLGILKVGAAYIPMDPTYPKERLQYMATQSELDLILSSDRVLDDIDYFEQEIIALDGQWEQIAAAAPAALPEVDPESIAYVIFTSGSTGLPKGVQVPHRAVVNFLMSMATKPGLGAQDRLLAITTLSFDIAVLELYLPLVMGGRTVIASDDQVMEGSDLRRLLEQHEITVMQATPSTWRSLLAAGWQGGALKALCGGEPFPSDLAATLAGQCSEVWNMYGPTETTVWSLCREVFVEKPNIVGRPIDNTVCYVVSAHNQAQPIGVAGELLIGGTGVTKGYLNRPELTEKAFVSIPSLHDGVLYRTGDAVRLLADGQIEYIQRIDNQVKVRGYRIELGEIESVLLKHDDIAEAAVVVREYSEVDKRIIAYVRFVSKQSSMTMTELRRYLRDYLPDYMIPQQLVEMAEMPLTPNGKIDRKALPDPNSAGAVDQEIIAPRTIAEKAVAEIWMKAIGLEQVSLDQYFFDIGGHSMLSMQVIYQIEEAYGVQIKATDMVLNTLEQIAAMLPQSMQREESTIPAPEDTASAVNAESENKASEGEKRKGLFGRLLGRKR